MGIKPISSELQMNIVAIAFVEVLTFGNFNIPRQILDIFTPFDSLLGILFFSDIKRCVIR